MNNTVEKLKESGKKLSKSSTKAVIAAALGVVILSTTVGCGSESGFSLGETIEAIIPGGNKAEPHFPIPTLRPEEEIIKNGPTQEDILANLDLLCLKIATFNWSDSIKDPDKEIISAQFTSISVCKQYFNLAPDDLENHVFLAEPFYFFNHFEGNANNGFGWKVYLNYVAACEDDIVPYNYILYLPDTFAILQDTLGNECKILDDEMLNSLDFMSSQYKRHKGCDTRAPLVMDREYINNISNTDALKAFWDVANDAHISFDTFIESENN